MNHRVSKTPRLALSALAAAVLTVAWGTASGLSLGRLSTRSALGEALRAEIDVTSLTPEEASSLELRIASPETYRSAGVEYNPVLGSAQAVLDRRADGRPFVRLSSSRAAQEPFVDVILEATWSSGRVVREYTLLLDPPRSTVAQAAPVAPVIGASPPAPAPAATVAPAPRAAAPTDLPRPALRPAEPVAKPMPPAPAIPATVAPPPARVAAPAPVPAPAPASARVTAPAPLPPRPTAASDYTVRAGDTLGAIASRTKPGGISLDQMLVALFRANPDAFLGENMNRLRAGAVLSVPTAEEAASVTTEKAQEFIVAQSADFAAYRQRLAERVPTTPDTASRQAAGKVMAAVEDRKQAAAPAPDKLKLSQGGVAATEAKISRDTAAKDTASRVAELARNVEELKKLQGQAPAASPAPAAASGPGIPLPLPAPAALPVPAKASAAAPPPPVSPSGASAPAKPKAAEPAPEEVSFLDDLLDSPYVLPGAVLMVSLLAGIGVIRMRRRSSGQREDSMFLESRVQPDSFFGGSGGGRVNTRQPGGPLSESPATSSMGYSLSQLDAIGDVDPVAEADVYLAYGRDLQAEEILREAMRTNPDRVAVPVKLLEVYAKRRDGKGFEALAMEVRDRTGGKGADWDKVQELAKTLDLDSPLFAPATDVAAMASVDDRVTQVLAPPSTLQMPASAVEPRVGAAGVESARAVSAAEPAAASGPMDLELDLDVSSPTTAPAPQDSVLDLELDLDLGAAPTASPAPAAPEPAPDSRRDDRSLEFDLNLPSGEPSPSFVGSALGELASLDLPEPAPAAPRPSRPRPLDDSSYEPSTRAVPMDLVPSSPPTRPSMDFNLDDINLDLNVPAPAEPPAPAPGLADGNFDLPDQPSEFMAQSDDPLVRKIDLADEFRQIGDEEGARELLREVLAEAQGDVKARAQKLLDDLA